MPFGQDPRIALAQWANESGEWIRRIVLQVLGSNSQITENERDLIYRLFLEEKGFNDRSLPAEPLIPTSAQTVGQSEPFHLSDISSVKGVNALVEGEKITFGSGLTLLFGENGTGKTGYVRILKRLAGSRSADEILRNIDLKDDPPSPSAQISYRLGDTEYSYAWNGERAQSPFDRMSIFDSPSVQLHVDSELSYTYSPASLVIFNRVNFEVQQIAKIIEEECGTLKPDSSTLLGHFHSRSSIHPYIESLGADTNLTELQEFSQLPDDAESQCQSLETTIARLRSDGIGQELSLKTGFQKVLTEALAFSSVLGRLNVPSYNGALSTLSDLHKDRERLRDSLFAAADLPAEPDNTWEAFIRSGQDYRRHLESLGVHVSTRCLYCRQVLGAEALQLIAKYGEYLEDQIAQGIEEQKATIRNLVEQIQDSSLTAVRVYVDCLDADPDLGLQASADQIEVLKAIVCLDDTLRQQLTEGVSVNEDIPARTAVLRVALDSWLSELNGTVEELRRQNSSREESKEEKEKELYELKARLSLNEFWPVIENVVSSAKRQEKLRTEREAISTVLRSITGLSTKASEQLINKNFEQMFRYECAELRAPELRLEFFGREGHPLRRRTLPGDHKPSRVLSEGEQKVIAIADFIAEAKMSDNSVPVVFDDPVSSLDHRRVEEVAARIADLASEHQVVVFTHDIFFTACLLATFDKTEGCIYYRVTDEDGKGTVTPGTGPRWDTISNLTANINLSIEGAKKTAGEEQETHIRDSYSSIRSWCELFVEQDMLAKVTERYQPNVRMTNLDRIKVSILGTTIETVTSVFADACGYIDAHSQPLPTLGVAPKLSQLQVDWEKLKKCRTEYLKA